MRLEGRLAVVTGAARGIGEAIGARFAAEGASVALVDVDDAVHATADSLGGIAVVADLGDPDAARSGITEAIDALGGIDILVNNAGVLTFSPVLDLAVADWDRTFDVNVRSMLVTTQTAVPVMIEQGRGGRLINLASMGAKLPAAGQAHYAASKAAVVAFTTACAKEFGPFDITANSLCPGYVLTEMGADTRTPEMVAEWSARSPLGRCAEPSDVANMALFCASDDGGYCTGQSFNVTGGMATH